MPSHSHDTISNKNETPEQFALTESAYVAVRLLQHFPALASRDPLPWREKLSASCTSLGGCKVALTPASLQQHA